MTDERTPEGAPEPTPTSDPPPLAPYVQQASAAGEPAPAPVAPDPSPTTATPVYAAPPLAAPVAPPPVAWGAPPVAVAAAGGRTTLAAVAGVMMIVLGVLGGLLGIAVAVLGSSIVTSLDLDQFGGDFGGINDPASVISGAIAFVGIIVVVYSLVYLIGGIGIVRSRGWGRVMGLIVGILSGLVWLSGLSQSETGNIGFTLIMLAIHVYIVVVLIMFWRTKTA